MEIPNSKDLFKDFVSQNTLDSLFKDFALDSTEFTEEGLALIEKYQDLAKQNPAVPLAPWEVQLIGDQLCSEQFGEDFQIIRQVTRNESSFIWGDKNSGYLNEDGVTYSYTKHGLISVFNGQPNVVKVSATIGKQTCYYVFDRTTLTVIPERTIIHTTGEN